MGYVRDKIRAQNAAKWDAAFAKAFDEIHSGPAGVDAPVPPLLDFIPATTPEYEAPTHLAPVIEAFEPIAKGGHVELALSVPPRHFKTTTLLHGIAWLMLQRPGFRVAYLTYNQRRAEEVSREAQRIARRAGLKPGEGDARGTMGQWETANGCRFVATSISGGVVGSGFDLIIIDDPYRRRQDAESALLRRRVMESWAADVYTRQETTGTSFIVVHTRWHPDDLIGNITDANYRDGHPFHYVNLPALSADGKALAPRFYDKARLLKWRAGVTEYEWASQYQGEPIAKGGRVFDSATLTDEVPTRGQYAIGIDLAYSKTTLADYSVAVVICRHGTPKDSDLDHRGHGAPPVPGPGLRHGAQGPARPVPRRPHAVVCRGHREGLGRLAGQCGCAHRRGGHDRAEVPACPTRGCSVERGQESSSHAPGGPTRSWTRSPTSPASTTTTTTSWMHSPPPMT